VFVAVGVAFGGSAAVLALRRSDDWLVLFVALMLLTFGTVTLTGAARGLALVAPRWQFPTQLMSWLGDVALMLFFVIFPTGRLAPRWGWLLVLAWATMQGLHDFWPGSALDLQARAPDLFAPLFVLGIVSGLAAQVYRYFRVSG